jgi:aspartate racemase
VATVTASRIGLIGGLSWESTASYYKYFHELYVGGDNEWSAPEIIIDSVDFGAVVALQQVGDWEGTGHIVADAARRLELAGATVLGIGANTMHKNVDDVRQAVGIPVVDVRDAVASEALAQGFDTLALLGTKYLIEGAFYSDRLDTLGVRCIKPNDEQTERLQAIIYSELTKGIVTNASRDYLNEVANSCRERGAQVVGLCCTEFGLLMSEGETVIDSTRAHVRALLAHAYRSTRS